MAKDSGEQAFAAAPSAETSEARPKAARRKRRAKRRGKSGPVGRPQGTSARPFPRVSLERALTVAKAIGEKNGGKPWPPEDVANTLDLSVQATPFFYLAGAARDYGLTDGGRDTSTIALTDLGKKAVYPASEAEESATRVQAFRNVPVFADVLDHYGGNRLPELQYVKNTLKRDFSIED